MDKLALVLIWLLTSAAFYPLCGELAIFANTVFLVAEFFIVILCFVLERNIK